MKKREFIAAACFICIFGILVTVQVKRFVSEPAQRTARQEYAAPEEQELKKEAQNGSDIPRAESEYDETAAGRERISDTPAAVMPEGAKPEAEALDASASESSEVQGAAPERSAAAESCPKDSSQEAETARAAEETAEAGREAPKAGRGAAFDAVISPVAETGEEARTDAAEQVTAQAYQRELDSTAASIKKLKSSETDTSTWSYLNLADYELKLWDNLLNRIYQDIIENMDETEAEELRKEEKAWIKMRDADAKKVSSRYSGGTLEGLEHTASLAQSTKDRAYELLEDYGSFLPQEEISEEK